MGKKKRKYNIGRVLRVVGVIAIVIILHFAIKYKTNSNIQNVSVQLVSHSDEKLVEERDIITYIKKALKKDIEIEKIEDVDIKKIEELLNHVTQIKHAQVFLDSKQNLSITCELRNPVVRVCRGGKKDIYLDENGTAIPLSKRAVCRVPIVNGNVNDIKYDEKDVEGSLFGNILEISKKIYYDDFLNPLIEQLYIDKNSKLILIPKLGRQEIVFGDWEQIDDKLDKIKAIYKSGMKGSAWREFKKIDLNWEGQVVITKTN